MTSAAELQALATPDPIADLARFGIVTADKTIGASVGDIRALATERWVGKVVLRDITRPLVRKKAGV